MSVICAMQPYLFPYLPYFQLAGAVDAFWVLDDVQFIRRGWMQRNRILRDGATEPIVFPVARGTRGDLVSEKMLAEGFEQALNKVVSTLRHAYARAPYRDEMLGLVEGLPMEGRFLDLALEALRRCFAALGIGTPLRLSSGLGLAKELRGQERILALCEAVGARAYVNPAGGRALYDPGAFTARGIVLRFLEGVCPPYPQTGGGAFVPGLSVLDLVAQVPRGNRAGHVLKAPKRVNGIRLDQVGFGTHFLSFSDLAGTKHP